MQQNNEKCRQHSDFPGGHPPEYYPSLKLLDFADRTGYGTFSLRWPSTKEIHYPLHPLPPWKHHSIHSTTLHAIAADSSHSTDSLTPQLSTAEPAAALRSIFVSEMLVMRKRPCEHKCTPAALRPSGPQALSYCTSTPTDSITN